MRTRDEVLEIPDKPTMFCVDIVGRGEHHFRMPPLSVQYMIMEIAYQGGGTTAEFVDASCAAIGVCWHHQVLELEATLPIGSSREQMLEFSRAVQMELADDGYTPQTIMALGKQVIDIFTDRITEAGEAKEVGDFSEAQLDAPSSH